MRGGEARGEANAVQAISEELECIFMEKLKGAGREDR